MIRIDDAHFSFGGKPLLEGASVLVPEGARAGLLGRNGAGKTTLFRLILGDLTLETGTISIPRGRRCAYLPQSPAIPQGETLLAHVLGSHAVLRGLEEEILRLERKMETEPDPVRLDRLVERHRTLAREFESAGGFDLEARVAGIVEGLGFARPDLLQEAGVLSPGERNRVALAKVLLADADVLLLDEPTNFLDLSMLEWLEDYLRDPPPGASGAKPTVLVASHDRWFLNRFADHIIELRDGSLHAYRGDYDAFARQREEEIERAEKSYLIQQAEIARDLEFIRRNFAAQKARQAKSREKRLARLELARRPPRESSAPSIRFRGARTTGAFVLRVQDLSIGQGDRVLLRGVDFAIEPGERVAILGPNGCGKTTLLKCIVGSLAPLGGEARLGPRTVIGYYEQEPARAGGEKSVFAEVHDLVPRWTDQEVRDLLAAFLFRGDEIEKATESLSGGEKARLALIRLILSDANLLVLDEPTNHLDVHARAALEKSLGEFPGSILFVSHDRYFVESLADRVLAFEDGELRQSIGGYAEYREACAAEAVRIAAERERARAGERASPGPKAAEPSPRAREDRLVKAIAAVEEDLKAKRDACGREEHYRNPEAMRNLKKEIAALEERLEGLYREWEGFTG